MLFAIDQNSEEIIVSDSPKGSKKIEFIERIARKDHETLYHAVMTLTSIAKSPEIDPAIFKGMDKVCQMIYKKYREADS